mgnify:CR=1 FL=1
MVQKIVFHLGDYKTGSTSIQRALLSKSLQCETRSVAYPTQLNHRAVSLSLSRKREFPHRAKRFGALAGKIRAAKADTVVVSDESFEEVSPRALQQALEDHMPDLIDRVHLISYVRPHAERILSSYTQSMKLGFVTGGLDAFHKQTLKRQRYLYTPRFSKWREVFQDRFTLRPMVRAHLYNQDVVGDFFHYLLDQAPFQIEAQPTSNPALSVAHLAMLRAFHRRGNKNAAGTENKTRGKATWHLARMLEEITQPDAEKLQLHHSLAEEIVAAYTEDARALDAAFFDQPIMASALTASADKAIATRQSLRFEDHFDADTRRILTLMMQLTDDLMARNPDEWKGYFRKIWVDSLQAAQTTKAGTA